jgi:hypothetical protein
MRDLRYTVAVITAVLLYYCMRMILLTTLPI